MWTILGTKIKKKGDKNSLESIFIIITWIWLAPLSVLVVFGECHLTETRKPIDNLFRPARVGGYVSPDPHATHISSRLIVHHHHNHVRPAIGTRETRSVKSALCRAESIPLLLGLLIIYRQYTPPPPISSKFGCPICTSNMGYFLSIIQSNVI
jgi:hypothetical protein